MAREKAQAAPTARPKVPMRALIREVGGLPLFVLLIEQRANDITVVARTIATPSPASSSIELVVVIGSKALPPAQPPVDRQPLASWRLIEGIQNPTA